MSNKDLMLGVPNVFHYVHVHDEEEIRRFAWLLNSDLGDDRVRLVMLLARRKYMSREERDLCKKAGGKSENIHLTRQIVQHSDPHAFLRKLRAYEVPLGTYVFRESSKPIPQSSMALYVTLQPKSMLDATVAFQNKCTCMIRDLALRTEGSRLSDLTGLDSLFKGEIHKATARDAPVVYLDLDVDTKDFFELEPLRTLLGSFDPNPICFSILTRGGYHVVLDKSKLQPKTKLARLHDLASQIKKKKNSAGDGKGWLSIKSDGMVPIPGTLQGGFPVRLCNFLSPETAATNVVSLPQ